MPTHDRDVTERSRYKVLAEANATRERPPSARWTTAKMTYP